MGISGEDGIFFKGKLNGNSFFLETNISSSLVSLTTAVAANIAGFDG